MKKMTAYVAAFAVIVGLSGVAGARPEGVHAEKFPCTRCHTKSPGPNDTLEDAPLVMPIQELCASCHETSQP